MRHRPLPRRFRPRSSTRGIGRNGGASASTFVASYPTSNDGLYRDRADVVALSASGARSHRSCTGDRPDEHDRGVRRLRLVDGSGSPARFLQRRPTLSGSAPHGVNDDHVRIEVDHVVDVVPRLRHQHLPHGLPVENRVDGPELRVRQQQLLRPGKLTCKEITSRPMLPPPPIAVVGLLLGIRGEADLHSRARSLPITSSASMSWPAFA